MLHAGQLGKQIFVVLSSHSWIAVCLSERQENCYKRQMLFGFVLFHLASKELVVKRAEVLLAWEQVRMQGVGFHCLTVSVRLGADVHRRVEMLGGGYQELLNYANLTRSGIAGCMVRQSEDCFETHCQRTRCAGTA